jgi:hypothetical protein
VLDSIIFKLIKKLQSRKKLQGNKNRCFVGLDYCFPRDTLFQKGKREIRNMILIQHS